MYDNSEWKGFIYCILYIVSPCITTLWWYQIQNLQILNNIWTLEILKISFVFFISSVSSSIKKQLKQFNIQSRSHVIWDLLPNFFDSIEIHARWIFFHILETFAWFRSNHWFYWWNGLKKDCHCHRWFCIPIKSNQNQQMTPFNANTPTNWCSFIDHKQDSSSLEYRMSYYVVHGTNANDDNKQQQQMRVLSLMYSKIWIECQWETENLFQFFIIPQRYKHQHEHWTLKTWLFFFFYFIMIRNRKCDDFILQENVFSFTSFSLANCNWKTRVDWAGFDLLQFSIPFRCKSRGWFVWNNGNTINGKSKK